jgi:hypothetical protein
VVQCGTWSETSIAQSQLSQFWQILRQNAFLFPVHGIFHHNCPLPVKPAGTPRCLVHKKTWIDSLRVDMLHFGVTIPATVPQRSEIPEGLVNYPVFQCHSHKALIMQTTACSVCHKQNISVVGNICIIVLITTVCVFVFVFVCVFVCVCAHARVHMPVTLT